MAEGMNASKATKSLWAVFLICVPFAMAQPAYFLMQERPGSGRGLESYVVKTSNQEFIREARDFLARGGEMPNLVARALIAPGHDGTNFNYATLDGPSPWDWHVTELVQWIPFDIDKVSFDEEWPGYDNRPSEISDLVSGDPPLPMMTLIHYPLLMELKPGSGANLANISTRGWAGSEEQVLIAGFIVQGGEPRNILVRALGPTLRAFGVVQAVENPRIEIFRGSERIAANDDWEEGNFVRPGSPEEPTPWYAGLFPTDPKEAAVRLALPPGVYSAHVRSAGDPGVALLEVYDLDELRPE